MPLDAFALALGAAFLHALWNVLLARTRDPQAATAATFCMAVLMWAPVAAARWRVEAGAWKYIAASAVCELAYVLLLGAAYVAAPLSVFYPIARGLAPVLILVVAVLALNAETSATRRSACARSARASSLSADASRTERRRSSASRSRRRSPATR
jgi:multidrug transporter EmrE-like cation transporter